ncbi:LysR family transcriptional regulator [Kitasatospora sp. MY 5-36]|uniref:LysR family transcriptional regulator n=1 Tax=unclassified Kitasatospora TaxID=2633591 RepID=UPI0006713CBB|nr:LysR family transcriptional regulator [Kitasatospora sp. MY 5-36]
MITLQQLRCFQATLEHGSFTAAAAALGYAQPSISEQVRLLEKHLDTRLFRRVGRGLVPTEAARALQPHATAALAAVDAAGRAVASVRQVLTGTVRLGVFRTARHYLGSHLVADVLTRHPGLRVELVGPHSVPVLEQLRRGALEVAVVALPFGGADVTARRVMRDELVYVSADAARASAPVTPAQLAAAQLVLPDVSWRQEDSTRRHLLAGVQAVGGSLHPRIEVEETETALEIAATGLADTVTWRGVLHGLAERVPPGLHWAPLSPPLHETFAVVHPPNAELSPAAEAVAALATARMRRLDTAVRNAPLIGSSRGEPLPPP